MIDAKLAREISNICASSNKLTARFIVEALAEIEVAVCEGKILLDKPTANGHQREVIALALQKLGYGVQWSPRPEPGWHVAHISW